MSDDTIINKAAIVKHCVRRVREELPKTGDDFAADENNWAQSKIETQLNFQSLSRLFLI